MLLHRRRDPRGRFIKGHSGNPVGRPRAIEKRLARAQAPGVVHRRALRACAAIAAGETLALSGQSIARSATMRSTQRLGAEAAAELSAIPDTDRLRRLDEAFAASYPQACAGASAAIAGRMLRLIERYRRDCGFDEADQQVLAAAIAARAAAFAAAAADPAVGDLT